MLRILNLYPDESITAYMIPRQLVTKQGDFSREHFHYDKFKDRFICPEGNPLYFRQLDDELPHLRRNPEHKRRIVSVVLNNRCVLRARPALFHFPFTMPWSLKRSVGRESRRFHRLRNLQIFKPKAVLLISKKS